MVTFTSVAANRTTWMFTLINYNVVLQSSSAWVQSNSTSSSVLSCWATSCSGKVSYPVPVWGISLWTALWIDISIFMSFLLQKQNLWLRYTPICVTLQTRRNSTMVSSTWHPPPQKCPKMFDFFVSQLQKLVTLPFPTDSTCVVTSQQRLEKKHSTALPLTSSSS